MKFKSYLWSLLTVFALAFTAASCSDDDEVVPPTPQPDAPAVTLKSSSMDVAAEGGEHSFGFTVANATDAKVEATTDAAWVENVTVKESRASFDGEVSFSVKANSETVSRKATITVSYKGAKSVEFELTQVAKGEPTPEPQPEGPANDGKVKELTPEQFVKWIYDVKNDAKKENFLGNLPAVIDFYGPGCGEHLVPIFDHMAAEFKGQINFFRFNFTKPEAKEIKNYMGVTMCPTLGFMKKGMAPAMVGSDEANAITTDELMKAAIKKYLGIGDGGSKPDPEPDPQPQPQPSEGVERMEGFTEGNAPKLLVSVGLGSGVGENTSTQFYFVVDCKSKDATAGSCGVWSYAEISAALQNSTLPEVLASAQDVYKFSAGDIKGINIGGAAFDQLELTPATSYSLLVELKNKEGGRVIEHYKVTTTADNGGATGESKVIPMDNEMFKSMVWDFTTSSEFQYKGHSHMFIEFGADWCHNCKDMEPIVAELSVEFGDRIAFFSVNRDANNNANRPCFDALCKVTGHDGGIPFFVMITADGKIDYTKGNMSKSRLKRFIENALPSEPDPDQPVAEGPTFTVSGSYNGTDADLKAVCSSKDATAAKYVFLSKTMVDNLLKIGNTLETLVDAMATSTKLTADELNAFNGDGFTVSQPIDAGSERSFIMVAQNAKGGKSAQRADVKAN